MSNMVPTLPPAKPYVPRVHPAPLVRDAGTIYLCGIARDETILAYRRGA